LNESKDIKAKKYTSRLLYTCYALMLISSVLIFIAGVILGNYRDVILAVPVILILMDALFVERTVVHIPPLMIFLVVGLMILLLIERGLENGFLLDAVADVILGVVMGLSGLIITYSLLRTLPEIDNRNSYLAAFVSLSLALSFFTMILMIQYALCIIGDVEVQTTKEIMSQLMLVTLGAAFVSVSFYLNKHTGLFHDTINQYLETRSGTIGENEYEIMEIERILKSGESEKAEYKSTLRTNLTTGEKDVRMEKAVLKTIVAFLNSRGGTLLIGISDSGDVVGIDENSFDNRDKLNLHLTNLIASQIGNEFLPFISFKLTDYKEKGVMRVVCRKSDAPVFFKEGKQETFYVRSGPSSVELNGMDVLNYVDNRFKKRIRKKRFEQN
jgi:Predicted transcriptional regulator containing an HTH domain and an uncharacterized domain shared with the mammalian protein Schlafen